MTLRSEGREVKSTTQKRKLRSETNTELELPTERLQKKRHPVGTRFIWNNYNVVTLDNLDFTESIVREWSDCGRFAMLETVVPGPSKRWISVRSKHAPRVVKVLDKTPKT